MEQKDSRFAVLIDADNVSPKYIKYILDEVSDQGVATYKRIYGDWTDISKKSWKEQLLRYSINPIQQYSNTNGKNSTDSRDDHRCHGHPLLRKCGGLLPGFFGL